MRLDSATVLATKAGSWQRWRAGPAMQEMKSREPAINTDQSARQMTVDSGVDGGTFSGSGTGRRGVPGTGSRIGKLAR